MDAKHLKEPPERKEGWPDGQSDVINKYGTYEVQRNADTESRYPMIAAGLAYEQQRELHEAAEKWKKKK